MPNCVVCDDTFEYNSRDSLKQRKTCYKVTCVKELRNYKKRNYKALVASGSHQVRPGGGKERMCLKCDQKFKHEINRICPKCTLSNEWYAAHYDETSMWLTCRFKR